MHRDEELDETYHKTDGSKLSSPLFSQDHTKERDPGRIDRECEVV
jgi:hypothetical protein